LQSDLAEVLRTQYRLVPGMALVAIDEAGPALLQVFTQDLLPLTRPVGEPPNGWRGEYAGVSDGGGVVSL
ncbi:hypothetical protein SMA37_26170, partial [Escherichia coli]|uniref:hypothetical protein n=1 Tax=Escherichia coli TaxID=562 RepID=UPI00307A56DE